MNMVAVHTEEFKRRCPKNCKHLQDGLVTSCLKYEKLLQLSGGAWMNGKSYYCRTTECRKQYDEKMKRKEIKK